eukprot:370303-Alexandrium_andersonii.AAC.1
MRLPALIGCFRLLEALPGAFSLDGQVRSVTTAVAMARQFARNELVARRGGDRCVISSACPHGAPAAPLSVKK